MPKVDISEPLPGSEPGCKTLHDVSVDGAYAGKLDVCLLRKEDVKLFKGLTRGKLKRKLEVGKPFSVRLILEPERGLPLSRLGKDGVLAIVDAVMSKLEGMDESELYVLELLPDGRKQLLGKGHELRV